MQFHQPAADELVTGRPLTVRVSDVGLFGALVGLTLALGFLQELAGARPLTTNWAAVGLSMLWLGLTFVLGLWRPAALVYTMAFFSFFTAWRPVDLPVGSFLVSQLLAVLAVAVVLVRGLFAGRTNFLSAPAPILLLLAVISLSAVQTVFVDPTYAAGISRAGRANPLIRAITAIMAVGIGMSAYFAVTRVLTRESMVRAAITAWVAGGVVTSMVGFYLFVRHYVQALPSLPSILLGSDGRGIIQRSITSIDVGPNDELVPRVSAFVYEPRHMTYLLSAVLCFLAVYHFSTADRSRGSRRATLFAIGACLTGFALTAGRSTYVLVPIIMAIVAWCLRKRLLSSAKTVGRLAGFMVGGSLLILAVFALLSRRNPFDFLQIQLASLALTNTSGSSVAMTIGDFMTAWLMFLDSPIFGRGWGSYVYFIGYYNVAFVSSPSPNNAYLLVLAEAGIIGLLALLWVFWSGARLAFARVSAVGQRYQPILQGIGAALLVTYICFFLWDVIFYPHLWMLLGFAQALRTLDREQA